MQQPHTEFTPNTFRCDIVRDLNQAGLENEDIRMMLSPTHSIASMIRDASLFNSEKTSAGTAGLAGFRNSV